MKDGLILVMVYELQTKLFRKLLPTTHDKGVKKRREQMQG
jgi:hypothetical protein